MNAISSTRPAIEYRFNAASGSGTCPVCGVAFESSIGMWPHLAGSADAVCGGTACPVGEDVTTNPTPCDMLFELVPLEAVTVARVRDAVVADGATPIAETFRHVSLDDDIPDTDRNVLQLAAIDLLYCQADGTRIERFEPQVVLRTCGEAAGELLLSGCGALLAEP